MARPVEKDPSIQLRAGVRTSVVKKLGGINKVQKLIVKILTDKANENGTKR